MRNNKIAFVFMFDHKIATHFWTAYESLLEVYGDGIDVYAGIDVETSERFSNYFDFNNIKYKLIDDEVKKFSNFEMLDKRITKFSLARLKMFEVFEELVNYKTVIYVDVDVYFKNEINTKYIGDLNNYAFSEIENFEGEFKEFVVDFWKDKLEKDVYERIINLYENGEYFNAGVLIVNDKDKYERLVSKVLSLNIMIDDQTMLNYANDKEIVVSNEIENNFQISRFKDIGANVYHFTTSKKPWNWFSLLSDDGAYFDVIREIGYVDTFNKALINFKNWNKKSN